MRRLKPADSCVRSTVYRTTNGPCKKTFIRTAIEMLSRSQRARRSCAYLPRQMNEAIQGLVAGEALYTLFQPIIDGATREPIGHEALTRGPNGPLEMPNALFAAAAAAGLSVPLERRALELEGRLFLNLLPQTLLDWKNLAEWLGAQLAANRIDPHDVVLEVTEHGLT